MKTSSSFSGPSLNSNSNHFLWKHLVMLLSSLFPSVVNRSNSLPIFICQWLCMWLKQLSNITVTDFLKSYIFYTTSSLYFFHCVVEHLIIIKRLIDQLFLFSKESMLVLNFHCPEALNLLASWKRELLALLRVLVSGLYFWLTRSPYFKFSNRHFQWFRGEAQL